MNQSWEGIKNNRLGRGVVQGLLVRPTAGLGNAGLNLTVDPGIAVVGTLQDDAGVPFGQRGHNQPGKLVERLAATTQAVPDNVTRLLWLKTDNTLALTAEPTGNQTLADVAPEKGPDPDRGSWRDSVKIPENNLREIPIASVYLAKVTSAAGAITVCDGTKRDIAIAF